MAKILKRNVLELKKNLAQMFSYILTKKCEKNISEPQLRLTKSIQSSEEKS